MLKTRKSLYGYLLGGKERIYKEQKEVKKCVEPYYSASRQGGTEGYREGVEELSKVME